MQAISALVPPPILATLFLLLALGGIWYFKVKLAQIHAPDVRIVWYLFFLALVCSLIIAAWGTEIGAIDGKGSFHGSFGGSINLALKFMLSLNEDIKIFSTLLCLVIIPQFGTYLLSGLVGCASAPILVGRSFSLFTWAVVKSFVSAAGVVMALAIYGYANNWAGWNTTGSICMGAVSLVLLLLSFYALVTYRQFIRDTKLPGSLRYEGFRKKLEAWMSRNADNRA